MQNLHRPTYISAIIIAFIAIPVVARPRALYNNCSVGSVQSVGPILFADNAIFNPEPAELSSHKPAVGGWRPTIIGFPPVSLTPPRDSSPPTF